VITVDLKPSEYSREGEAPRKSSPDEPFFGDGAPEAIGYLVGLVLTVALLHLFMH